MADIHKDTIYIDVEDEITTVIDKVTSSDKKLVALVLPKRASVFQSIVNMKLLKRKSDESAKNLVLITAESGLLPLAGAVGIHVAKSLDSKPEIPPPPIMDHSMLDIDEDESLPIGDSPKESSLQSEQAELKKEALKEIAKTPKSKGVKPEDVINLDNTGEELPGDTAMPAIAKSEAKKKAKKDKSFKIPNFNRFRVWAVIGVLAIVIIVVLWFLLFDVFPHANISIKTNAQNVNANLTFNLASASSKFNPSSNSVPSSQVTETKTYSDTVNATGQQNNGQKATGTVKLSQTLCPGGFPQDVPAGTGLVQNNQTYITDSTASQSDFGLSSQNPKTACYVYNDPNPIDITAQNPGTASNTGSSNVTFTDPSSPSSDNISATGSAVGGTDNMVTVVSQTDISNAQNKITINKSGPKSNLSNQLIQNNYYPLNVTFNAGSPNVSSSASAGTIANSVTVTETVKYSMYGINKQDLNQLLASSISSQVGAHQTILNNGLSSATYSIGSSPTNLTVQATAIVGPNININSLKKELVGMKVGQINSTLQSISGVSSVSVKFSPFYVSQAPSVSKITIKVAKPTNQPNNASNS